MPLAPAFRGAQLHRWSYYTRDMIRAHSRQIRDRFAKKSSTRFAPIRNRFVKVCDGFATDSRKFPAGFTPVYTCLLYTSDAADDM
eukprot:1090408-Prymnesium_polylepis.1